MIIINHTSKSASESILYSAQEGKGIFISSNTGMKNPKEIIEIFKKVLTCRAAKPEVFHFKISISPEDKLDDEGWSRIAFDIRELLGLLNCPYAVYRHTDRPHDHIHLIISRVTWDGELKNPYLDHKSVLKPIARDLEMDYKLKYTSSSIQSDAFFTHREKQSMAAGKQNLSKGRMRLILDRVIPSCYSLIDLQTYCRRVDMEVKINYAENNKPDGISYWLNGICCSGRRLGPYYMIPYIEASIATRSGYLPSDFDTVTTIEDVKNTINKHTSWRELSFELRRNDREIVFDHERKNFDVQLMGATIHYIFQGALLQKMLLMHRQFMEDMENERLYSERCEGVNGRDSEEEINKKSVPKIKYKIEKEIPPAIEIKKTKGYTM